MKMLGKCILLLMSCQLGVQLVMIKLTKLTLKAAVPLSYARAIATDQDFDMLENCNGIFSRPANILTVMRLDFL